jgi:hypothetical protein
MFDSRNHFYRNLFFWLNSVNENCFPCDVDDAFSKLKHANMLNARLLIFSYFSVHSEKLKIDPINIDRLNDYLSLGKVDLTTLVRYKRFVSFQDE